MEPSVDIIGDLYMKKMKMNWKVERLKCMYWSCPGVRSGKRWKIRLATEYWRGAQSSRSRRAQNEEILLCSRKSMQDGKMKMQVSCSCTRMEKPRVVEGWKWMRQGHSNQEVGRHVRKCCF